MDIDQANKIIYAASEIDMSDLSHQELMYYIGCVVSFAEQLKPFVDAYFAKKMEKPFAIMIIPEGGNDGK